MILSLSAKLPPDLWYLNGVPSPVSPIRRHQKFHALETGWLKRGIRTMWAYSFLRRKDERSVRLRTGYIKMSLWTKRRPRYKVICFPQRSNVVSVTFFAFFLYFFLYSLLKPSYKTYTGNNRTQGLFKFTSRSYILSLLRGRKGKAFGEKLFYIPGEGDFCWRSRYATTPFSLIKTHRPPFVSQKEGNVPILPS